MMKSVGEVMSIARSFEEAFQKAVRELDIGKIGLVCNPGDDDPEPLDRLREELANPTDERIFKVVKALKQGLTIDEIYHLTGIDRWFLHKFHNIIEMECTLRSFSLKADPETVKETIEKAKRLGFSDRQIAVCLKTDELVVREFRKGQGIVPRFKIVDTMGAEWPAKTNYCYLTYGDEKDDVDFGGNKEKVVVLGAGCIRIGSSVEFDYCTMHTAWSLKEEGIDEVIVINNNPETVSTDYDMSDKLYFEEITLERVLDIVEREDPMGVVVSVGGQTPNNLALPLARLGVRLIGTSANSIDRAEDRSKFSTLLDRLEIPQPIWSKVTSLDELKAFASKVGYPVLIRPSYVLSGAAMRVAKDERELTDYVHLAARVSPDHPTVVSKFMPNAKEVEVDAVSDGRDTLIGAIIEHIELAGTHSGDATMVIPPQTLSQSVIALVQDYAERLARALNIHGPFNVQYLVRDGTVYVIECNLRASRSAPYTSKVTGIPLIWIAAKVMMGRTLRELNVLKRPPMVHVAVKAPTFSFMRLKGADPVLGVEMTSTGEVACLDYSFAGAYIKALKASNMTIPTAEKPVLITVREEDRAIGVDIARKLSKMGYPILATRGTTEALRKAGITNIEVVKKVHGKEKGVDILDYLRQQKIGLVINTPSVESRESLDDEYIIRRTAIEFFVPVITRIETVKALVDSLEQNGYNLTPRTIMFEDLVRGAPLAKYV